LHTVHVVHTLQRSRLKRNYHGPDYRARLFMQQFSFTVLFSVYMRLVYQYEVRVSWKFRSFVDHVTW